MKEQDITLIKAKDKTLQNERTGPYKSEGHTYNKNKELDKSKEHISSNSENPSNSLEENNPSKKDNGSDPRWKRLKDTNPILFKDMFTFIKDFNTTQKETFTHLKNTPSIIREGINTITQLIDLDGMDWENEIKPTLLWVLTDEFYSGQFHKIACIRKKWKNKETAFANALMNYQSNGKRKPQGYQPKSKATPEQKRYTREADKNAIKMYVHYTGKKG